MILKNTQLRVKLGKVGGCTKIMEKKMEAIGLKGILWRLYRDYLGLYRGYLGILETNMETTVV